MFDENPFSQATNKKSPEKPTQVSPTRRILRVKIGKNGSAAAPEPESEDSSAAELDAPKRKRGRPPRDPSLPKPEKGPAKKRGRPPRDPSAISTPREPKRRGRPPLSINIPKETPSASSQPLPPPIPWSEIPANAKTTEAPAEVMSSSDAFSSDASSSSEVVHSPDKLPENLIVLPINNRPVMPGITIPLQFQGENIAKVLQAIADGPDQMFGVALAKNPHAAQGLQAEMHPVGTVMKLLRVVSAEDGVQVLARAIHRIECKHSNVSTKETRWAVAYRRDLMLKPTEEIKAYTLAIISQVKELLGLSPLFQEQLKMLVSHLDYENPGLTMDLITAMTTAEAIRIQEILATFDLIERAKKVMQLLREETDIQRLQQQIKSQIDDKISAHQKEFFLREQLKVIKKELGIEKDEKSADLENFRTKLDKLPLSEEARKVANEELEKLSMLEPNASEYPLIRGYLSWFSDLPWGKTTADNLSLPNAKQVLDASHFGLDDVKDRILEFIATVQKRGSLTGSILCLVGPPGVGKTSVGRSIAEALGRKYFRFSVGGMRDESEIKGHRRTYIGAMPGKLIQSLKRCESSNPVILIDEIDKMSSSFQGDPAAALLEVLDPEQNKDFLDHYLDVRFDLSKVLFITTANSLDTIPAPLLDRMEIIKLSGYILEEKLEIARHHLIPAQLKEHGLVTKDVKIPEKILTQLIDQYAREAGVRNLENQLKKIFRKIARRQVEGNTASATLDAALMQELLGLPIFAGEELYNAGVPGVALGLAWTSMGGATLYMEANALQSAAGGFKTTGRLGETMSESAQIAYSLARKLLCEKDPAAFEFFNRHMVHLHVPEGATPKDGPSAGITMTLALYSLATGKAIKPRLAMTGEVTLTGKVLPIGGVREKVIAARRLKVMELILPKENERDFVKLPDYIKQGVKVHYADWFGDVLQAAFADKVPTQVDPRFRLPAEVKPVTSTSNVPVIALTPVTNQAEPVVKRRGRPALPKPAKAVLAEPKRRGRPPAAKKALPTEPKRRGRPRKG